MSATPSVYVFNATPNKIGLSLNGYPLTTVAGITSSSSYAPNSTTVARNASPGNPGIGEFGGQNSLLVYFPNGGGQPQTYPVNISSQQVPMTQDLQLYVFFSQLVLVTSTGQTDVGGQSTVLTGSPATAEEMSMIASVDDGGSSSGGGSSQQSSGGGPAPSSGEGS